jgi:hypothetical protein
MKDTYTVVIKVRDSKTNDVAGEADNDDDDEITVTINVTNVNESPVYDSERTTRSVHENTGAGENIGDPVAAMDADAGDTLEYSLGGTDAGSFDIDEDTGQLQTRAPLNYEARDTYTVTVTATDGSLTDTITVTITVLDVTETGNNAPMFTVDDSVTFEVAENGNLFIGRLTATDADTRDTLTYSLSGDGATLFRIGQEFAQLYSKEKLNYEATEDHTYTVTVTVSDGAAMDTITVTITVTDVNDSPMFADETATREVAENTEAGEDIGDPVAATDEDDKTLVYNLDSANSPLFTIDSEGQLKTYAPLNREGKSSYRVTITASDDETPTPATGEITVTINVMDVNEPPTFDDGETATRTVREDAVETDVIGSVTATDPESDVLTYTIDSDSADANSFEIGENSGRLTVGTADW